MGSFLQKRGNWCLNPVHIAVLLDKKTIYAYASIQFSKKCLTFLSICSIL